MSTSKIQEGDSITIYEKESGLRYDVLATEINEHGIVGPYSVNGRTFDEGSFLFADHIFPGDQEDALELLCDLVRQHQKAEHYDESSDEAMTWAKATALAVKHDPSLAGETVAESAAA